MAGDPEQVPVLLVIDRSSDPAGICAMVWTSDGKDPQLLESRTFQGEAALQVWLAGLGTKYGRSNIQVQWTDVLLADDRLAAALEASIDARRPEAG
jgi:hypothetical protein